MAQKTQTQKNIRFALIGLIIIAIIAIGKTVLNKFASGINILGSKASAKAIVEAQKVTTEGVRPSINNLHITIHDEIAKYGTTSETLLVELMNECANKNEVAYVSAQYTGKYSKSLRSVLRTQLDAGWRKYFGSKGATWDDLNDIVKENLV